MILMIRPDGGSSYIHESRIDEYRERGFKLPAPPKPAEKPETKKRKTTKE